MNEFFECVQVDAFARVLCVQIEICASQDAMTRSGYITVLGTLYVRIVTRQSVKLISVNAFQNGFFLLQFKHPGYKFPHISPFTKLYKPRAC